MDSGQAITIGQPGVHDYDVEDEARAMAPRATRYQVVVDTDRPETQMAAGHDDIAFAPSILRLVRVAHRGETPPSQAPMSLRTARANTRTT
jgi:hypothetical protein